VVAHQAGNEEERRGHGVTVAVGVRGWQISLLSFQVKKYGEGKIDNPQYCINTQRDKMRT